MVTDARALVYATRRDIGLPVLSFDQLCDRARALPQATALRALSAVRIYIEANRQLGEQATWKVARQFNAPELIRLLEHVGKQQPDLVPFAPQQIYSAQTLVLALADPQSARTINDHEILDFILSVGDHCHGGAGSEIRSSRHAAALIRSLSLANRTHSPRAKYWRFLEYYEVHWERASQQFPREAFDIHTAFRRATGITLDKYFSVLIAMALAAHGRIGTDALTAFPAALDRWAMSITCRHDHAEAAIATVSKPAREFVISGDLVSGGEWATALHLFDATPFAQVGDEYILLSLDGLERAATEGPFWIARGVLGERAARRLLQFRGRVFETQLRHRMQQETPGLCWEGTPPNAHGHPSDLEIDQVLIGTKGALLCEYGVLEHTRAEYTLSDEASFDHTCRQAMKKFRQLEDRMRRLIEGPPVEIDGLDLAKVGPLVPTLVVFGAWTDLGGALRKRLLDQARDEGLNKSGYLERVQIVAADDFLRGARQLRKKLLPDLLVEKTAGTPARHMDVGAAIDEEARRQGSAISTPRDLEERDALMLFTLQRLKGFH